MSKLKEKGISLLGMREVDIPTVMQIELKSYSHPWTEGIFEDCLKVGYPAWILLKNNSIIGYIVLSAGAQEAHVLNICISQEYRRQGLAEAVMSDVIALLKDKEYLSIFLEVRVSNIAAAALYEKMGFERIGTRKGYYEAQEGREDAATYKFVLRNSDA